MGTIGLCLVTFFTACIVTYINVFTSEKFNNLFFLIYNSEIIILYCIIYGFIGITLLLILEESAFTIIDSNTNLSGSYFSAFLIGLATKVITEIKFFDLKYGNETVPIGLKTVSSFIDTQFDKTLNAICLERFLDFISSYRIKYENTNLTLFKVHIVEILSFHPSKDKINEFSNFVMADATSTNEILERILIEFGKRTLNTINKNVRADL